MFWPLFEHIKKNDIAMTAPVEMTYSKEAGSRKDEPVAMSFMYADPEMSKGKTEGNVEVVDISAETVLSVTVRGGYEKGFEKGMASLREHLEANPGLYEVVGSPRFLGYNSPFVPGFLQIGEAQIPVKVMAR
jgi:effector-binding domain-containing protein